MEYKKETIEIFNEEHGKLVQQRLFELGYSWSGGCLQEAIDLNGYNHLCFSIGSKLITKRYAFNPDYKLVTTDELFRRYKWEVIKVYLTSEYTAEIYPKHIKVGCQEIINERFEELMDSYNKAHEK